MKPLSPIIMQVEWEPSLCHDVSCICAHHNQSIVRDDFPASKSQRTFCRAVNLPSDSLHQLNGYCILSPRTWIRPYVPTLKVSQHIPDADQRPTRPEHLGDSPARVLRSATDRLLDEERASGERRHELQLEVSPRDVRPTRERRSACDCQAIALWVLVA